MDKKTKNIISLLIIGLVGYNYLKGKGFLTSKKGTQTDSTLPSPSGGSSVNPVFQEAIKLAQSNEKFKNLVKNFQNHANRINSIISGGKYPTITIDGYFGENTDRAAKTAFPNTYSTPKSLDDLDGQIKAIERVLKANRYQYKELYVRKMI